MKHIFATLITAVALCLHDSACAKAQTTRPALKKLELAIPDGESHTVKGNLFAFAEHYKYKIKQRQFSPNPYDFIAELWGKNIDIIFVSTQQKNKFNILFYRGEDAIIPQELFLGELNLRGAEFIEWFKSNGDIKVVK